jgi:hypothetical protein
MLLGRPALAAGSYLAEMNGQTYPVVVPSTGFAVLGP